MSGDRRRMTLSSTTDHTITMLNHITVFPADRPGMPLFVLFLLFSASLECQITQCARGNVRFHHHPKVFLFAALVLLAAMVSSTRAWDGLNNCLVVEVKWLCRNHVMLCSLCFLHFTHSSFVFCACKWTNAVSQNCHRMVSILRRVTSQKQYSPAPLRFIKLTAIICVYQCVWSGYSSWPVSLSVGPLITGWSILLFGFRRRSEVLQSPCWI